MSNKRSKRNNNKVLKALRQKRANGGRTKKFYGGVEMGGFNIPSEEQIRANIQKQQQSTNQETAAQKAAREAKAKADKAEADRLAATQKAEADRLAAEKIAEQGSVTVSGGTSTTTTTPTTSTNDPKPTPPKSPRGMGAASKSYQEKVRQYNADLAAWEARNLNVTEGSGSGSATDIADSTAQQGDTMSTIPSSGSQPPKVEITPPDKFDIEEVKVEDVSLEGTALGPAEQIGAQQAVTASTVAKAACSCAVSLSAATALSVSVGPSARAIA